MFTRGVRKLGIPGRSTGSLVQSIPKICILSAFSPELRVPRRSLPLPAVSRCRAFAGNSLSNSEAANARSLDAATGVERKNGVARDEGGDVARVICDTSHNTPPVGGREYVRRTGDAGAESPVEERLWDECLAQAPGGMQASLSSDMESVGSLPSGLLSLGSLPWGVLSLGSLSWGLLFLSSLPWGLLSLGSLLWGLLSLGSLP